MRKITSQAVRAFYNRESFKSSNTRVVVDGNEVKMYLFNNLIAVLSPDGLEISNAGWQSDTTKERLNGLEGVSICQKAGTWYLNGKEWNGKWTKI